MSNLEFKRRLRILDFDIENRPLSYWVPDRPTAEVTAIAWAFYDDPDDVQVWLLGRDNLSRGYQKFLKAYNEADMVTGHYIRKHDLPILNGSFIEAGFECLSAKMTCDTKLDYVAHGDIPATQEHLADLFGVEEDKVHMTQEMWREANRLTRSGLQATESRVEGDVRQHMALRLAMLKAGVLSAPKMWRP